MTYRQIWFKGGRDRRRRLGKERRPGFIRGDWSGPLNPSMISLLPGDFVTQYPPFTTTGMQNRPYVIDDPPFATTPGDVYVVMSATADTFIKFWGTRLPGDTTNPKINASIGSAIAGNPVDLLYLAWGIQPGATVAVTGKTMPSGTNIPALTMRPTATDNWFIFAVPRFTMTAGDSSIEATITWTGGTPIMENFAEPFSMVNEGGAIAVPATVPGGYTFNPDTTNWANAAQYMPGDFRRLRSGPNQTYENMGFGFSFAPNGQSIFWWNGVPYNYNYPPTRLNAPLPFTVFGLSTSGAPLVAPGCVDPTLLTTPLNSQPLTRLGAGVTSDILSGPGNLAFLPPAPGWYQVLDNGTPLSGVGEDEFGWKHLRTIARSSASGRPFYAAVPSPSGFAQVLTSYSPPSPTSISSSGTTITLASGSFGAWCSVSLPSAGQWKIMLAAGSIFACGMVVDVSASDPTVTTPDSTTWWEPYIERACNAVSGGVFHGILSTPPTSPHSYDSWIIGTNPSGAWANYTNHIVVWDSYLSEWVFFEPDGGGLFGSIIPNNPQYWFDGTQWHSNGTDPQISIPLTTTGAQTIYLFVQPFDHALAVAGQATISWSAA